MIDSNNEIELIEKALMGNQRAFKTLYDLHVDALYRFLCQFSDQPSQIEEWTQRAFIKAFKKLSQFNQRSSEDSTIWKKAKSAIQQLTPEKRMICLLHIAEDYSHAEIAQMIGITEGSSRIILHRAKQELRTLVSK